MGIYDLSDVEALPLVGHLSRADLQTGLAPITAAIERGTCRALLVDCRKMTGYDADARALFVEWNAAKRHHLRRVAVVTENTLWWMVIATMALASRQKMKPFSDVDDAWRWAQVDE